MPESSHLCLIHSAFLVIALTGLLLKVWCKPTVPEESDKSVSGTKLGSSFIVTHASAMTVTCTGKLISDLCWGRRGGMKEVCSRSSAKSGASFSRAGAAKPYPICNVLPNVQPRDGLVCKDLMVSKI